MGPSYEAVEQLAREHLPSDVAEKWIKLLRPAARLKHAGPGDAIVGELGGRPSLPEDAAWPEWDGHGPLSYVGAVDCGALAGMQLDIPVPSAGHLVFFLIDYSPNSVVTPYEPESLAGARVIYLPPGRSATSRTSPPGTTEFPRINLSAELVATYPNFEHPVLVSTFRSSIPDRQKSLEQPVDESGYVEALSGEGRQRWLSHPVNNDAFVEALWDLETRPRHQVGGYATPVQGPVEFEVATAARGGDADWRDGSLQGEAIGWRLLLQVDSDEIAKMMWGDVGMLYWMIQPAQLEALRFDTASFALQCG